MATEPSAPAGPATPQIPSSACYSHIDWTKTPATTPTLPELLAWNAQRFGERDLIVEEGERLTYSDADGRSAALAARLLEQGVGKDSRVGILLPNGIAFVVTWLAIVRIGAVAVPISTLSSGPELGRITRLGGFALLITTDRYGKTDVIERMSEAFALSPADDGPACTDAPHLRAIWLWHGEMRWASTIDASGPLRSDLVAAAERTVTPADPISIIFTSGSTADPKGVIHSHGTFLRSSRRWAASMPYRDADRLFATLPMFWVGGLVINLLTMMQVGGAVVTSSEEPAAMLDRIEAERCTSIQVFPMLEHRLTADPSFAGRIFLAMRVGTVPAMVPPDRRPAHPVPFAFAMGMSETAGSHCMAMHAVEDAYLGAMGLIGGGIEHRIVDPTTSDVLPEGERGVLHVRGDTLMLGYVGKERADVFDPDGWFDTGDICSIRDGHMFFHGRINAMIKTAGANVAPPEVEAAIRTLDGVAEVYALGIPDQERGEIVAALVVPKAGVLLSEDMIVAAARKQLSSYKVPRLLAIVETVPVTGTGKLDRRAAVAMLSATASIYASTQTQPGATV